MRYLHAARALTPAGWLHNVEIGIEGGRISALRSGATLRDHARFDTLLPALGNLHSHTFQRAMAGMTEARAAGRDSFWTWRSLMYRFMDRITPEQYEAIAALVFMEMLEAGYASVGEFHYVHHQPGGAPYDSPTELSDRVFARRRVHGDRPDSLAGALYLWRGRARASGGGSGAVWQFCERVWRLGGRHPCHSRARHARRYAGGYRAALLASHQPRRSGGGSGAASGRPGAYPHRRAAQGSGRH